MDGPIGIMVFSYLVTCAYIHNIMGSTIIRGLLYPFFHAKGILMKVVGLETEEDQLDNAIYAHNVKVDNFKRYFQFGKVPFSKTSTKSVSLEFLL
jgi:hypothetical protein